MSSSTRFSSTSSRQSMRSISSDGFTSSPPRPQPGQPYAPEPRPVAWDPARGVFLIAVEPLSVANRHDDHPEWPHVRRVYDRQAREPAPIVRFVPRRRGLIARLRKIVRPL